MATELEFVVPWNLATKKKNAGERRKINHPAVALSVEGRAVVASSLAAGGLACFFRFFRAFFFAGGSMVKQKEKIRAKSLL